MPILSRYTLNGTTFLRTTATPDVSIDAPEGSIVYDTMAAKRYKKVGTSWEEISPQSPLTPSNVPLHASKHIRGAIDEIDGDRLDVDFVPTNYTATATGTGIAGVSSTQHLTAHLKGIDNAINAINNIGNKGPQGDPGPQGPPGIGGMAGAATGLPVLNVLYLNEILGEGYANAVQDVESGGDAIQGAIDYFIEHPGEYYAIYIPPGTYRLSTSLIIAKYNSFCACEIISTANANVPRAGKMSGADITWNTGTELDPNTGSQARVGRDKPLLIIQGARRVSIQGVQFRGINTGCLDIPGDSYHTKLFDSKFEDFYDSDIRDNPFSPNCCVAVDPFLYGPPGGLESNKYPGLEEYYFSDNPPSSRGWAQSSSNIHFKECAFLESFIGIAISPGGPGGTIGATSNNRGEFINPLWTAGIDYVTNSEDFEFTSCYWHRNTIHYSSGQSQARQNTIYGGSFFGSFITFDTAYIGPQGNIGVPPVLSGGTNIGGCKYVFNVGCGVQTMEYNNVYCESIASLGNIGIWSAAQGQGARFSGCSFHFLAAKLAGEGHPVDAGKAPGTIPAHLIIGDNGIVSFDMCSFIIVEESLKIFNGGQNQSMKTTFTDCSFVGGGDIQSFELTPGSGIWNHISKFRGGASYLDNFQINSAAHVISLNRSKSNNGVTYYDSITNGNAMQRALNIPEATQTGIMSQTIRIASDKHPEVVISAVPDHPRHGEFSLSNTQLDEAKLQYRANMRSSAPTVRGSTSASSNPNVGDIVCLSPWNGTNTMMLYLPLITGVPHVSGRDHHWSTDTSSGLTPAGHYTTLPKLAAGGLPIGHISKVEDLISPLNGSVTGKTFTVAGLPLDIPYGSTFKIMFQRWDVSDNIDHQAPSTQVSAGDGKQDNAAPNKVMNPYPG